MDSKLPLYHWIAVFIPGSLLVAAIGTTIHSHTTFYASLPIASQALLFFTFSLLAGEIIQALGSIIEPFLRWTWGEEKPQGIFKKYAKEMEAIALHLDLKDASPKKVFEFAMALCNKKSLGRVDHFNTLYAQARSLVVLMIALLIATLLSPITDRGWPCLLILAEVSTIFLFWNRAKKRSSYFSREVILQAYLESTNK